MDPTNLCSGCRRRRWQIRGWQLRPRRVKRRCFWTLPRGSGSGTQWAAKKFSHLLHLNLDDEIDAGHTESHDGSFRQSHPPMIDYTAAYFEADTTIENITRTQLWMLMNTNCKLILNPRKYCSHWPEDSCVASLCYKKRKRSKYLMQERTDAL